MDLGENRAGVTNFHDGNIVEVTLNDVTCLLYT